ncbi:MAG: hypothetical protein HY329_08805 [Chloroflexi bacterium]|nr:hypothetical protein [Chloroflexota bacterium]
MTTTRTELHRLIEQLPDEELDALREWLEARQLEAFGRRQGFSLELVTRDPVLRALAMAPFDDEEETDEERAEVAAAKEELARGEGISWDDYQERRRTAR